MEQNHLTAPDGLACHERRAIAERGNHSVGKGWVGLRHDLRRHGHIGRHSKAKEWRSVKERCQRLGLAPAHSTPDATSTRAQPHRHQGVFVIAADLACCQTRTGKAEQHAALINPLKDRFGFRPRKRRNIGKDDHVRIGGQNVQQATAD